MSIFQFEVKITFLFIYYFFSGLIFPTTFVLKFVLILWNTPYSTYLGLAPSILNWSLIIIISVLYRVRIEVI